MKVTDFQPILDMISAARDGRILVVTHERPDGDAVGSAAGLRLLLQENGCTADVLFPDDLPDAYRGFVPEDMWSPWCGSWWCCCLPPSCSPASV